MKAICNREELLAAFGMVSGVVPARSPKPILQNLKLSADPDVGSVLMATDLEVGIRHQVTGMKVEAPGAAILPPQRISSILRTSTDEDLYLETDGEHLIVKGRHAEFTLPSEVPDLYPEVPDKKAGEMLDRYFKIEANLLKVKSKYLKKMQKVLPPAKVFHFAQLDNRLDLGVRVGLAKEENERKVN